MRRLIAAGLAILLPMGAAFAQSPTGEWRVKDGTADIRIADCGGALWGVIAWTQGPAGTDEHNPDPALRGRSVMGMPILLNMHQSGPNRWDGQVYNAEDGSTYTSHIALESPDALRIEGCVLGGLICGGEAWTRVPSPKGSPSDHIVCSRLSK